MSGGYTVGRSEWGEFFSTSVRRNRVCDCLAMLHLYRRKKEVNVRIVLISSLFTEICCTDIFTASNDSLHVPLYHRAT